MNTFAAHSYIVANIECFMLNLSFLFEVCWKLGERGMDFVVIETNVNNR